VDDIVQSINELTKVIGQRTVFDYLSIILPIVFSFLAICISIATAKKQNNISLFDKRMKVYEQLQKYLNDQSNYLTAECKLLGYKTKFAKTYTGDKEFLFSNIKLLFSKNLWKQLEFIIEEYRVIHYADSCIDTYFSLIAEDTNNNLLESIKEYIDRKSEDNKFPLSKEEEMSFKQLCDQNAVVYDHPVDGVQKYNYYELSKLISDNFKEVKQLEKKMLITIENEISLNKIGK
jgi:hypothetical protein